MRGYFVSPRPLTDAFGRLPGKKALSAGDAFSLVPSLAVTSSAHRIFSFQYNPDPVRLLLFSIIQKAASVNTLYFVVLIKWRFSFM